MKYSLLINIFLPLISLGQNNITTTLLINTSDCKEQNRFGNSKLSNDTIEVIGYGKKTFYIIDKRIMDNSPIKVEGFKIGTYRFKFYNFFGEKIIKVFTIKDTKKNYIELCPNELKEYKKAQLLNSLNSNDSLVIKFSSGGHGLSRSKCVVIKKVKNIYQAKLLCEDSTCEVATVKWSGDSIKYICCKVVNLTEDNIADLAMFENEFNKLSKIVCSYYTPFSFCAYTVNTKISKMTISNCTYEWHGFSYLQEQIFGYSK